MEMVREHDQTGPMISREVLPKRLESWSHGRSKKITLQILVGGFNPFQKYYCSQTGSFPK